MAAVKVKVLRSRSLGGGIDPAIGDVIELDEQVAADWIRHGWGVIFTEEDQSKTLAARHPDRDVEPENREPQIGQRVPQRRQMR